MASNPKSSPSLLELQAKELRGNRSRSADVIVRRTNVARRPISPRGCWSSERMKGTTRSRCGRSIIIRSGQHARLRGRAKCKRKHPQAYAQDASLAGPGASVIGAGAEYSVTSRDLGVFMDQAAEPVSPQYPHIRAYCRRTRASSGRILLQRPVRTMGVVMICVLAQDQLQVPLAGDQHPVQALAPGTSDPAFGYSVRPRRLDRGFHDPHADGREHRVEPVVNFVSRSRIANLKPSARTPRFIRRLRACWLTHSPIG